MNKYKKIYFVFYLIIIILLSVITFHSTQDYYKYFQLGKSALKHQQFAEAVEYLVKAFQIKPTSSSARLLVTASLKADDWGKVIAPLEYLHKKQPADQEIYELLADAYYKNLQLDKAENSFREILKLNPKSQSVRRKLAEILTSNKQYKEAAVIFSELCNEYPDNLKYQEFLGDIYSFDKMYDEAIAIYKRLLDKSYKTQSISLKIADILRFQGRDSEAIKYYKNEKNN